MFSAVSLNLSSSWMSDVHPDKCGRVGGGMQLRYGTRGLPQAPTPPLITHVNHIPALSQLHTPTPLLTQPCSGGTLQRRFLHVHEYSE
jgi:hypothetical protein